MKKLERDDFAPLSTFPFAWRWTDGDHAKLPRDVLQRIRPLRPEAARAMWEAIGTPSVQEASREAVDASGDPKAAADALVRFLAPRAAEVLLFWNPQTALLTTTDVFCSYWDDFCYPGADDVIICTEAGAVLGHYDHEEQFHLRT